MEFYSQIDGVAMESPLGPTLANIFLCHHEKKWLNDCPNSFKSFFIRETLMTSSSCLKNLNMFKFLLTTWTVNTKTFRFLMKQEKMKRYLSQMLIFSEKRVSLSLMCIEKKLLLDYTPTFPALYHQNKNLVQFTRYYTDLLIQCVICPNFIWKQLS